MPGRIRHFLEWGVSTVWVIDSGEETVEVFESLDAPRRFSSDEQLPGEPILEGFRMPVSDLFVQPAWWA